MKPFDKYCSTLSDEALMAACSRIRHVALDMDGTPRWVRNAQQQ